MKYDPVGIKTLISENDIAARISQMGQQIKQDYQGKNLTILVVLKGSFIFAADLMRAIDLPMTMEFIGLSSYGSQTTSSGVVKITMDNGSPLGGQHLLVVEDIVDTGLTLSFLIEQLWARKPKSIAIASLLHKPSRTQKEVPIDYLGFTIPDEFVIGYGLDLNGQYRNLPYIGIYPSSS